MKTVQRHAVVENWDDDFADEDEEDFEIPDAYTDMDLGLDIGRVTSGPSSSSLALPAALASDARRESTNRLGLVSPRSMGSFRHAPPVDGGAGDVESDSDSDEESWDEEQDQEDEREVDGFLATQPEAGPGLEVELEPLPMDMDTHANGSSQPPPSRAPEQVPTSYPEHSSISIVSSPSSFVPPLSPPTPFATVASSPLPPPPPSSSSSLHRVLPTQNKAELEPDTEIEIETEFGAKPHHKGDEDPEGEFEDEDATITARSRSRRPARLVPKANEALVPPVPPVSTTPTQASPASAQAPAAPGRAPVFSPPVVANTSSSSSSSSSSGPPTGSASSARPATSSSVSAARPSTSSSARPSSSSSARPSTSSSARPSTSSSARPSTASSSGPGSGLRPHLRPSTGKIQSPQQAQAQRSSIASLLSVYTHRSRASSVSVSGSGSGSNPNSRRTSTAESSGSGSREVPPPLSLAGWKQRLFSPSSGADGKGKERRTERQSLDERARRVSVESRPVYAGRQSLDVLREGGSRRAAAADGQTGRRGGEGGGGTGAGAGAGEREQTKTGVLGFFGRRKRSNTVAVAAPSSSSSARKAGDEEDVYGNKKASKSQRSLLLLSRAPSVLVKRVSRVGRGDEKGKEKEKGKWKEGGMAGDGSKSGPAAAAVDEANMHSAATQRVIPPRGTKRRIPSGGGNASVPLAVHSPPSASHSSATVTAEVDKIQLTERSAHAQRTPEGAALQRPMQSRSNSNSLSSIGELRIPSRISQAQVSIRRDLGLVKEFAGKVAELKDMQGSYLQMIESVQGMIDADADNGQGLPAVVVQPPSRPRSNTSPVLSRPPSRSPLAALFQGPEHSSNAPASDSPSESPVTPTPMTPSTPMPSATQYSSADLAQRMADITARYDSWWECAELLIELGNTPPSIPTPVSTVRLVPPTTVIASPTPPSSTLTPIAAVPQSNSTGPSLAPAASLPLISSSSSSSSSSSPSTNHAESTLKPSRGRAHTFAGQMPVARLRSASTSTAAVAGPSSGGSAPHPLLSPSASAASAAPSHTWRATTGRHDLSERQLVLLRQMLGVDHRHQKQTTSSSAVAVAGGSVVVVNDHAESDDEDLDGEDDVEDATWRWGHANTVQLPSPAEEKEAYFGVAARKQQHRRPWSRAYHRDVTHSEDEDGGLAVYVTPPTEPAETKKSKGMNAIRDMLRTLKRAHPPTPRSSTFPTSIEVPPSLINAPPKMSLESARPVFNTHVDTLAPANKHAVRRAASLLPLSSTAPSARVPSSSSSASVSRASKIDPTLAFAMTPDNIKPLLDNAREVSARLGECVADVQALLASAGVDAIPG